MYKGGQFIPRQVVETLSKKQIQMVSEGKEVKENESLDFGEVSESLSRFVVAETILFVFYLIGSIFYEFNWFIFMDYINFCIIRNLDTANFQIYDTRC